MSIKQCVKQLVDKYGTNDPFEIAEKRNILIMSEPLGNILGYFNTSRRIQMIHLNNSLEGPLRRFVCAHELGHSVLHPKLNTPFLRRNTLFSVDRVEREANSFAVELLVPDEEVMDPYESTTVREVAATYGVPYELMRLKRLDTSGKAVGSM
ncbi:ImmA/IrrE family metallo-endopeptidase [Alicyclobacillus contaminans]|uniref:ImmA/IrrE family metallo-endopeptidase n=1 Tax=Alicyclobacillus contaminans TaxID=392016 RepID=UPI000479F107|nr:ImmA/IrrE family metallo-endopeptidase [Alicyclobacillus contaminans]GMA52577.1 ImmA/IrrE family metallo-endopeptidase [Alicyclobacillus contaminans]GMA52636.1 ImmA/IrrE family metallo-endopeptidase [Alicyclobacillus contaminans]